MAKEDTDSNQSQTDPGEADVTSSEGEGQESANQSSNNVTLEQLEAITGKSYKSVDKALKSIKDTQNYVGDLGSKVSQYEERYGSLDNTDNDDSSKSDDDSGNDNTLTKEEYERDRWFDKNDQYEEHREVIEALAERNNVPVSEVVEMEGFKSLLESRNELQELKSKQSVAVSNNRIGQKSETMDEARKAIEKASQARVQGDIAEANRATNDAKSKAVKGVLEAVEGK